MFVRGFANQPADSGGASEKYVIKLQFQQFLAFGRSTSHHLEAFLFQRRDISTVELNFNYLSVSFFQFVAALAILFIDSNKR